MKKINKKVFCLGIFHQPKKPVEHKCNRENK